MAQLEGFMGLLSCVIIFEKNNQFYMKKTYNNLLTLFLILISGFGFSQSIPSYVPGNGLVGWWGFNGNTNDVSGNNYNGILTGGQYTAGRDGVSNSAIQFNSSSVGYVDMNIGGNLVGQFSVMLWLRADRNSTFVGESAVCPGGVSVPLANSNQNWAMIPNHGGNNLGIGLSFVQNGIMVGEHSSNILVSRLSHSFSSTTFNQVVIVYRSDSAFLFLNGLMVRSRAIYCNASSKLVGSSIRFGGSLYSPNFVGILDDIGIWNRALSQQEVNALYTSSICGYSLTSNSSTTNQTVCQNSSITNIHYTTTGATGATVSGLPNGVSGTWSNNTINILGTPTETGVFNYTIALTGCAGGTGNATGTLTVTEPRSSGTLSGIQDICVLGNTTFSSSVFGGSWSSNATGVATVNASTGLVTGLAAGSATITYTVPGTGGCADAFATRTITITPQPNAGSISGTQALCVASTATFSSTVPGGTWSSSNGGIASVDPSTGLVTGVSAGTATITYTVSGTGGCANATATRLVTVNHDATLSASLSTICLGQTSVLSVNTNNIANYTVGSVGPGGGIIFYDAGSTVNGWRYMEAAPSNIQNSSWGCGNLNISGANSTSVGSGLTNSNSIANACTTVSIAAKRCLDFSLNGFDDWFLPSQGEFALIHQNLILNNIGNFNVGPIPTFGTLYWTSTQLNAGHGSHYCLECGGNFYQFSKVYELYVRPVRRFASSNSAILWSTGDTTANISVTPTVTTQYWVDVNANGISCRKYITITVNPNNSISLSSASGTNAQVVTSGTAITPITYTTMGATGATVTGLPSGVNGAWASNTLTISGMPSITGTFNYMVTMTGGCTGGTNFASGSIVVPSSPNIATSIGVVSGCIGDTVSVPITINMASGVSAAAISMAIGYDPTKLQCISSVTSLNSNIATGFLSNCGVFGGVSQFRAAWFNLTPVAFNGVMFNARFKILASGNHSLAWDLAALGNCEYADELANVIPNTTWINGVVTQASGCFGPPQSYLCLPAISTISPTSVGADSVAIGGSIINDGGNAIVLRGICYSTTPHPNMGNLRTEDGSGIGLFSTVLRGLASSTMYYARSYAKNSNGVVVYGNEASFTTDSIRIGSNYGGGIVFYLDSTGLHGFVCAPNDQGMAEWGCYGTSIVTSGAIGSGQSNTSIIKAQCSQRPIAASICDNLILNGYSDWYLPSKDELMLAYGNLSLLGLGSFSDDWRWCSTQINSTNGWIVRQYNFQGSAAGHDASGNKYYVYPFRAIRSF